MIIPVNCLKGMPEISSLDMLDEDPNKYRLILKSDFHNCDARYNLAMQISHNKTVAQDSDFPDKQVPDRSIQTTNLIRLNLTINPYHCESLIWLAISIYRDRYFIALPSDYPDNKVPEFPCNIASLLRRALSVDSNNSDALYGLAYLVYHYKLIAVADDFPDKKLPANKNTQIVKLLRAALVNNPQHSDARRGIGEMWCLTHEGHEESTYYHIKIALYPPTNNVKGELIISDYVKSLITRSPNEFMRELLSDNLLPAAHKNVYFRYLKNFTAELTPRNKILLLFFTDDGTIFHQNRNSFFYRYPVEIIRNILHYVEHQDEQPTPTQQNQPNSPNQLTKPNCCTMQ